MRRVQSPSGKEHFNPPTPWGVGPIAEHGKVADKLFQSTHPVGGGTCGQADPSDPLAISIHPPRGGWDVEVLRYESLAERDFNPPTPWGVGQLEFAQERMRSAISIHPPRGGWDPLINPARLIIDYFNPPTPWGVGLAMIWEVIEPILFQSTHPVGGGTAAPLDSWITSPISIHPPRGGWDGPPSPGLAPTWAISIHPPRGGWDYNYQCTNYIM